MVSAIKKILIIICLCNIPIMVEANQNCMILSDGSQLKDARFGDGALYIDSILFEGLKLRNSAWPSYSEPADSLFFEAYVHGKTGVYKANIATIKKPELVSFGKYPSLSPDGHAVVYFDERDNLAITNILLGTNRLIDSPITKPSIWKRPLWIDNNKIVYVTKDDKVFVFNLADNSHSILFADKLLPLASRNGLVLFTDHNAKKLFKYRTGVLSLVRKNSFLTMGPTVVLFDDGFLYSRQTWSRVLRLSESKSLFYYSFESDSENQLLSDYSLFGGTLIPCM